MEIRENVVKLPGAVCLQKYGIGCFSKKCIIAAFSAPAPAGIYKVVVLEISLLAVLRRSL